MTCAAALMTNTTAMRTMPEPERERQVALARLERDRRRHDASDAVDVAADDHDGADFGGGAAEPRQHDRDERIARVPEQRCRRGRRCRAERAQLLLVLVPRVFEHLARQRRR